MSDDIGTSAVTPGEDHREGVRAEIAAVIETAGRLPTRASRQERTGLGS